MDHMLMPGQHVAASDHVLPQSNVMLHVNPVNPELVHKIIQQLKIHGIFDEMRKECLADIDTKPAFLNLKQRVESHVKGILAEEQWTPSLNKNQLRSKIREFVMNSGILNEGVDRILHQVFSAKAQPVFLPKVQEFVKDKGQDIIKEFMRPPSTEISSTAVPHSQPGPPPPICSMEETNDQFQPPIPLQPPPPESPFEMNGVVKTEDVNPSDEEEIGTSIQESSAEIMMYEEQEFYVKDVASSDVAMLMKDDSIVKAISTPSPEHMSPRDEDGPKIPEDAVNPLRNLIESLLVSKRTMDSVDPENSVEIEGEVRVEDFSPTIDASQIESFTDEENSAMSASSTEAYSPKPVSPTNYEEMGQSSPESPTNEPYSPPSHYTPQSPGQLCAEETSVVPFGGDAEQVDNRSSQLKSEEGTTLPYDPSKFAYEQMSDSTSVNEGSSSAPSPLEAADSQSNKYLSTGAKSFDATTNNVAPYDIDVPVETEDGQDSNISGGSPISSSVELVESPTHKDTGETISRVQEHVEEMVEEIEVVEEFTSESEEALSSPSETAVPVEKKIPKAYQEKKKKKKIRKKKQKKSKAHKRARSSSISSGEITSSDSDSSTSSRPSRPLRPPSHELPRLADAEERRMHQENFADTPYWHKAGGSSDYVSGSPRMRRPFSPPSRPYSPELRRFDNKREMRYDPGPGPAHPFRERPVYRSDYRPRARFSPPPYRRSPPHRYSPGPRMDYPRMPFGSPRSPPRRSYSPPHIFHGDPSRFPAPRHRWPSPPRGGALHRMSSRSPPPGMRREGPGPSRY